jgi:transposase
MGSLVASERAQAVWEAVIERCCGLDVHQKTVTGCILSGALREQPSELLRTFSTTTKGLLELRDWLEENGCTHVAIESTGVYWRPVFHILEDAVTVLLVNAYHMKQVPGRKTDLKDAQWIARLLRCGHGGRVELETLLGEEKVIPGRVVEVDFATSRILLNGHREAKKLS